MSSPHHSHSHSHSKKSVTLTREEDKSNYASASTSPLPTPQDSSEQTFFDENEQDRKSNNSSPTSSDTNTDTSLENERGEEEVTPRKKQFRPEELRRSEKPKAPKESEAPKEPEAPEVEYKETENKPTVTMADTTTTAHGGFGETATDTAADNKPSDAATTGADFEGKVAEERKAAGEGEEATDEEMDKAEKRIREIIDNALNCLNPLLKRMVSDCDDAEESYNKDKGNFNEKQFVAHMKKSIEEASAYLEGALKEIQAVDPDKKVQRRANRNAEDNKATENQRFIADGLKKLSEEVQKTIDHCKEKIKDMPHASSEIGNMFGMLSRPLFQILSAVGLLVYGVLNLLSEILDTLGLGGVLKGLMDGLGINGLLNKLGWKLQIVQTDASKK